MSVRITEIAVSALGPIEKGIAFKPGLFNLVFGKNEKGKTSLVEFLVKSLFRNSKEWGLRDFNGNGRVTVDGLDAKAQSFSPSLKKKIEDFLDAADAGLPPDFSRLLVVKGAEADLSKSGADKASIARFLSGVGLLDRILNSKAISKTIQSAYVENGTIIGKDQGEINFRNQIEGKLKRLDELFDQIDREYSGGLWKKLSDEKQAVEEELETLSKARRHQAFHISEDIKSLEREKKAIDEGTVKDLRQKVSDYQRKTEEQKQRCRKQKEVEKKSLHYEWLERAREQYRGMQNERKAGPGVAWQVTALVFVLGSIALQSMRYLIPALLLLVAALVCGALYLFRARALVQLAVRSKEMDALCGEFESRFGVKLSGLSHLEEKLFGIKNDYMKSVTLKEQIDESENDLESLRRETTNGFVSLSGKAVEPETWNGILEKIEKQIRILTEGILDKKIKHGKLNVDEKQYEKRDPGAVYDEALERNLSGRLEKIKTNLADIHKRFENLKQDISRETTDAISISWPELICNLESKREEVAKRYRDLTAEMLGKIAVVQAAESIRKDENAKIEAGLNAPAVKNMLKSMTGRYDRLALDGEALRVGDAYQEFNFSDLSTGAREQVLLALRIGFASMLSKRDKLFLMLDDAFQYSDWERRERLVEAAAGLARQGWQVFYFTMDDHLRGLFDAKGKEFGKEYVRVSL